MLYIILKLMKKKVQIRFYFYVRSYLTELSPLEFFNFPNFCAKNSNFKQSNICVFQFHVENAGFKIDQIYLTGHMPWTSKKPHNFLLPV